jgi:hypothetical protein
MARYRERRLLILSCWQQLRQLGDMAKFASALLANYSIRGRIRPHEADCRSRRSPDFSD